MPSVDPLTYDAEPVSIAFCSRVDEPGPISVHVFFHQQIIDWAALHNPSKRAFQVDSVAIGA